MKAGLKLSEEQARYWPSFEPQSATQLRRVRIVGLRRENA